MKVLIVEDDFTSRRLLQNIFQSFAHCDVAEDGRRAIQLIENGWAEEKPYDLICLDIMMPEMNGQETLKEIRKREEERGILGLDGVKIIMTTALGDHHNVMEAFRAQCESYLVKPIDQTQLFRELKNLGFDIPAKK